MAIMPYTKVFPDLLDEIEAFSMAERGRILTLMLEYLRDGQTMTPLSGNERFFFPTIKGRMDREAAQYARDRENGAKGGRPKNPTKPNETQANPTKPKLTHKNPNNNNNGNQDNNQDNNKNENRIDADASCAERPTVASTPPSGSGFVMTLNDGTGYDVPRGDIETYKRLYPAVDVESELRAMIGWCMSNPTKRKTRSGIARFINAWLKKEQDKGGSGGKSKAKPMPTAKDYGGNWEEVFGDVG